MGAHRPVPQEWGRNGKRAGVLESPLERKQEEPFRKAAQREGSKALKLFNLTFVNCPKEKFQNTASVYKHVRGVKAVSRPDGTDGRPALGEP